PAVDPLVAPAVAEEAGARLPLRAGGHVAAGIRAEHEVEEAQMLGDLLRQPAGSGGRQDQAAPGGAILAQALKQRLAIGERRRVEIDALCDLAFEQSPPLPKPERHQEQA